MGGPGRGAAPVSRRGRRPELARAGEGAHGAAARSPARRVARGLTDKEIASELSLSPRTVEMHVSRALAALESANRAEAVRKAAALGLLD